MKLYQFSSIIESLIPVIAYYLQFGHSPFLSSQFVMHLNVSDNDKITFHEKRECNLKP